MKPIKEFKGEYRWLSNFWPTAGGFCVENHYQAAKSTDPNERHLIITAASPGEAKKMGRRILHLDPLWDQKKIGVMQQLVFRKFTTDPVLAQKLLNTGSEYLEEGNNWGDTFWGTCNGEGSNHLGVILMATREYLWFYKALTKDFA